MSKTDHGRVRVMCVYSVRAWRGYERGDNSQATKFARLPPVLDYLQIYGHCHSLEASYSAVKGVWKDCTCWNEVATSLEQNQAVKKTLQGKSSAAWKVAGTIHWLKTAQGNTEATQTQAGWGSEAELGRIVLDTHRLWRDFHQKLRPWRSDEHHYKLQLINVYHSHIKENRRDRGGGGLRSLDKERGVRGRADPAALGAWKHSFLHSEDKTKQSAQVSNILSYTVW